jgi:hypothetical protein
MLALYSYYQVGNDHAAALLPQVRAMQAALATVHGVRVGLKRRPESDNGLQTWMEIYDDAAASDAAGIDALIHGSRHTEVFTEMPPCA